MTRSWLLTKWFTTPLRLPPQPPPAIFPRMDRPLTLRKGRSPPARNRRRAGSEYPHSKKTFKAIGGDLFLCTVAATDLLLYKIAVYILREIRVIRGSISHHPNATAPTFSLTADYSDGRGSNPTCCSWRGFSCPNRARARKPSHLPWASPALPAIPALPTVARDYGRTKKAARPLGRTWGMA